MGLPGYGKRHGLFLVSYHPQPPPPPLALVTIAYPTLRFEAFDEPWKVQYNTPGKEWEDKWGLMDAARKIKSGLKIPDCGGKTAS